MRTFLILADFFFAVYCGLFLRMDKKLSEHYRQAFIRKNQFILKQSNGENNQDGEGITTRRQAAAQAGAIQPQPTVARPVLAEANRTLPTAKNSLPIRPSTSGEPIAGTSKTRTIRIPYQKEELLCENENVKIYVVKSELQRMVNFKSDDHHFILRTEAK